MIRIVDYGLGNVRAFLNVYKRLNIRAATADSGADLASADAIVLPGVGAFDYAIQRLNDSGMREPLDEAALERKTPVLGVCVGMHLMANASDEGQAEGLGWIGGTVRELQSSAAVRLPHMGWNDVQPSVDDGLLDSGSTRFYFLHSYYFDCANNANSVATSTYGEQFTCAVNEGNIHGVQFHPEKSHQFGVALLKRFATIAGLAA